ncbi:MAG: hypothetical protein ACOCTN_03985 [Candidatus Natronoplasma sp.]
MEKPRYLRPEYSSKITGIIFICISIYLFFKTDHLNAALASGFIGIFTILIINYPTVEEDVSLAGLKSGVLTYHDILADLDVADKGVHVPPNDNLTESRVYVPAGELKDLPDLYDEMTIVSSGSGKVGISVNPPGLPLLREAKDRLEYGIERGGLESGRECMGHLSEGMGLARSFSFREKDSKINVRITHGRYLEYCESLRNVSTDICTRTGCPICSAYLIAAAESLSQPLEVVDFEVQGRHIKFELEEV